MNEYRVWCNGCLKGCTIKKDVETHMILVCPFCAPMLVSVCAFYTGPISHWPRPEPVTR